MSNPIFTYNPFKSITLGGLLVTVATTVWSALDPHALTPLGLNLVNLIGPILTVLGLRRALGSR